jgi:hypothetical protein
MRSASARFWEREHARHVILQELYLGVLAPVHLGLEDIVEIGARNCQKLAVLQALDGGAPWLILQERNLSEERHGLLDADLRTEVRTVVVDTEPLCRPHAQLGSCNGLGES